MAADGLADIMLVVAGMAMCEFGVMSQPPQAAPHKPAHQVEI